VTFRAGYLAIAVVLLAIEIVIALFFSSGFIRDYFGDTLAVVLVYAGLRGTTRMGIVPAAATALAIAFVIEFGQLVHVLRYLGLEKNRIARTVLGSHFDPSDLAAYVAGAAGAVAVEAVGRRGLRVAVRDHAP
jgi:hypothetical protein